VTTRRPIGSLGVPELSEVQSNAVRELPARLAGGGRARRALRRRRSRPAPGRRVRARRAPGAARRRPRLHDRRPPEQVQALVDGWAEATWSAGIAFGTVGLQRAGFRIEITTYRAEAYDRSSRNPVVTYGDTIADDLVRRDFTVNAMAVALPDWRAPDAFVDLHGGLDDLAAGVLRTPARRRSPSATTRCGCCARRASRRSSASRSLRRSCGHARDGRPARDHQRGADQRRAQQAGLRSLTRAPGSSCS
jgi:hypothetical protein